MKKKTKALLGSILFIAGFMAVLGGILAAILTWASAICMLGLVVGAGGIFGVYYGAVLLRK